MTALPEVLEKLERVVALVANMSPGPLTVYDANDGDGWPPRPLWCFMNPGYEDEDPDAIVLQGSIHYGGKEDADAIAAAINFLQEHGPALLRDAGDAARWRAFKYGSGKPFGTDYVVRQFSRTFGEEEPVSWHDFERAMDERIAAMHAPGGAGND